jgi:glutaminase
LDTYGIGADSDARFAFLGSMPDPFTMEDLERAAMTEPLIARVLCGQLVVPNFGALSEKFEDLFTKMTVQVAANNAVANQEALNVMTIDGQRLHIGSTNQYLCAGDLISVALFAASMELLGLDSVMKYVSLEPSGSKSCADILNSENLPYNPFMWNGVLALCSLLEENFGDAIAITTEYWAKLSGIDNQSYSMQYDEAFEEEDKRNNFHQVSSLVHKSLHLHKFPTKPSPDTVVSAFFRIRSIKTCTKDLGSIAAVFANGGSHPLTNIPVFQPDTVKCVLSMMYSAGCEAQSGELSFKVGVPAKSPPTCKLKVTKPRQGRPRRNRRR